MKKLLISISSLFAFGIANAQATNTENYIQSRTYLEPVTITSSTAKQLETIQYFDGLGKPKQVVNVKASPTGKDLVTTIPYDGFGRQVDSWLPTPMSTLNGGIQSAVDGTTQTFYNDNRPFTHQNIENSPLDRIQQQIQVGTDWSTKPVQFDYDTNADGEIKKFTATFDYNTFQASITIAVPYGANQLYKNTITDEDGNQTLEFKNGRGQTVLVRKMLNLVTSADTYYVYNDYDQLAFVLSPSAILAIKKVNSGPISTSILDNLCYQYKYDSKNRLVEKKLPGKGWEYMVYDKADRLVLTQDTNMKANRNWLMTKYDQLGRVAYTGIINSSGDRATLQNIVNDLIITESRDSAGFAINGMNIYYSNTYFTSNITSVLSINYYDTYPTYSFNPTFPSTILGVATITDNSVNSGGISTKSLPVLSLVKNIEDDNWTKDYIYYDIKGRAIGSYSINHLGGYTKTESELDFAGVTKKTITRHKRLDTDTEKVITENFEYDTQNRLLVHKHQVDSNPEEILTQNKYNELSQLESKKVGGTNAATPLQIVDYTYNIRGWMTKINDPANLTNGKLFGYEMRYQNPIDITGQEHYNGNITEIDWSTQTDNTLRRYNYYYDQLNRLNFAQYNKPNATITATNSYSEWTTYDLNGNIATMGRYGLQDTTQHLLLDQLQYTYLGNRLNTVNDISQNPSGYPLGGNTISYDDNGNMTSHLDKDLASITYNYLNLPSRIAGPTVKFQKVYNYLYRADGTKVSKSYRKGTEVWTTDYLDGFQYTFYVGSAPPVTTTDLKFVPTSEGYYDFENNKYIYNYVDHLGNVRLSYTKSGSGTEIIEENNYYPFGLKHEGYNALAGNSKYNYKYNGKELQETGMYDYGARFYMPDLGRWGVVDPLAEKSRRWNPYNYVMNNPLRFIDPDGRSVWPPEGGTEGQTWSDDDGDFVYREGGWYMDNGGFIGALDPSARYSSVGGGRGNVSYDGKTMLPSSSYDYTYDVIPGKGADDVNYWKNGESGTMVSRFLETTGRDATAKDNTTTTIEALSIVATTGKAGNTGGRSATGKFTEPTLPNKTIVNEKGVTVEHYYKSGDHAPAHMHVEGGGPSTKIGANGKPIKGSAELSKTQQTIIEANKSAIRRAGQKINNYQKFQNYRKDQ